MGWKLGSLTGLPVASHAQRLRRRAGTLKHYHVRTPVRLEGKFRTPGGSEITVISVVADVDFKCDSIGNVRLSAARLSRCSGNIVEKNTGEMWTDASLSPHHAILEAAVSDLHLPDSGLRREILDDAFRPSGLIARAWIVFRNVVVLLSPAMAVVVGIAIWSITNSADTKISHDTTKHIALSPTEVASITATEAAGDAIEPAAIELAAIQRAAIEPAAIERAVIEPAAKKPAAKKPAAIEPAAIEPAAIEPAAIEPAAIEPAAIEPAVEPVASQQVPVVAKLYELRKWISANGKSSTVASYVSHTDTHVTIKKENGNEVTVELAKLSEFDRKYTAAMAD